MKNLLTCSLLAAFAVAATSASALTLTVNGSNGALSAQASFANVGGNLQITLTNTAAGDINSAAGLLTGLFFNISGNPALTRPASGGVVLNAGSSVVNGGSTGPGAGEVSGEFAYASGLNVFGSSYGIGNSGLGGIFGAGDVFPGGPLTANGGTPPDGPGYGITTAGWVAAGDNGSLSNALIKNSVVITLNGFGALTDPSTAISRVQFAYGTQGAPFEGYIPPEDTNPPRVPESGSTLILAGLALTALSLGRRFWSRS